jgi:hypothetical protein
MPDLELMPTAVTNILALPSITLVPERESESQLGTRPTKYLVVLLTRQQHRVCGFSFIDVVRFTRERRLVHFHVVARDDDAVGGQQVSILHLRAIRAIERNSVQQ